MLFYFMGEYCTLFHQINLYIKKGIELENHWNIIILFTWMQGVAINTFDLQGRQYPLVYGGDVPNIAGGFNSSFSR